MNTSNIATSLEKLGLTYEEARVYLELLKEPMTYLQISLSTGINRTTMYRLVRNLEMRSLVSKKTSDRGTFICATEPETLEVELVNEEEKLLNKRNILGDLLPHLNTIHTGDPSSFIVHSYYGQEGLKQMAWHELKTKGEILALGNGTIEEVMDDSRWAYRHRQRQISLSYKNREIVNTRYASSLPALASDQLLSSGLYQFRVLPKEIAEFDSQTIIYNDTVSIYHWKHDQRVGVEVISPTYASMMRQVFEILWQLCLSPESIGEKNS
jgi:DNA-binding MarR family transcriptional regulator